MSIPHVSFDDVLAAAGRIAPYVHRTPVLTSDTLNRRLNAEVLFKFEPFQKIGAFKARGATNAVLLLADDQAGRGVVCHSSGNHGQAIAYAASVRGIPATVFMPEGASPLKADAIRGYGATVEFVDRATMTEQTLARAAKTGATFIHPYENLDVIAGQGTAAKELLEEHPDPDVIVCPIGGGGLISGTIVSAAAMAPRTTVIGAEPAQVDDAYRSVATGVHQPPVMPPVSICDGLLAGLGSKAFDILMAAGTEVVTVTEAEIVDAAVFHLQRMKTVVEPSGAVPLAALDRISDRVAGKQVGVIVSGGNTDFAWLLG
jgi:threonine dehydratase